MEIRYADASEIPAIARLWAVAFPGKRTVAERIRMLETGGRYGGLETVLVARVDGELAGAAKIYALTEHITGVPLPMMGLAAVAVDPAMRRQGIAAELCRRAVGAAAERGDVVSVLYPFRPDYYERLGWGLVGRLEEHRFATGALPDDPGARHVRPARLPDDADAIAACYAEAAARDHGPIARDRRVWAYRLTGEEMGVRPLDEAAMLRAHDHPRRRAIVYDDGGISGYALLRLVVPKAPGAPGGPGAPAHPDRRTVVVRELVTTSPAAYRGLLGHLRGLADAWPRARHHARPEERFGDRLRDPRPPGFTGGRSLYFPTGRIVRGPMLRLLDVPAALARRRWFDGPPAPGAAAAPREAVRFTIVVEDGLRPENTGRWEVRVNSGARNPA